MPAPVDAGAAARELDRLQRFAHVHHPHLAEVLAVDLQADTLVVVCRSLEGELLTLHPQRTPLTVRAVQRMATDVLDALRALHQAGVVHGAVGERSLLLSPRAGVEDPGVLLLPVPASAGPADEPAPWAPVPPRPPAEPGPADDVGAAAAFFRALLHRVPKVGMEEAVLSASLAGFLERAAAGGRRDGDPEGAERAHGSPGGHGARDGHGARGSHRRARGRHVPAPGRLTPGPGLAPTGPSGGAVRSPHRHARPDAGRPVRSASRRRWRLAGLAVAAVTAAAVTALLLLPGGEDGRTTAGSAPTAATSSSVAPRSTSAAPQSPSPPPETIPGLIADLTARPDVAGPAGPLLLDGLQDLQSADQAVRQRAAVQVLDLLLSGQGLDPRYAAATRLALFRALAGLAPAPAATGPSCLAPAEGPPSLLEQGYARQVLERLASWQAEGFPAEESARLREMVGPVAVGEAHLVLVPCPTG
ncbi:hypothetical protein [Geodermatophilus tzadiensis]|uniref:hypothetical protein n=1 Tax=Geodermatophilus tzadiensis TaxID=1137988 RepID=UPI0011B240B6|nr:hypothetical protein [Geodermatophilus tzadiensis]